jgi:hypothetical protein
MPLSAEPVSRIRIHPRSVRFEAYARADGLWAMEAPQTDVKPDDYVLASGVPYGREPGTSVLPALAARSEDRHRLTWVNALARPSA